MAVRSRVLYTSPTALARPRTRVAIHLLLYLFAYGLALLALVVAVQAVVTWAQHRLDDLRYGMPRRVALLGVVGHHDLAAPTYLEAINVAGQISIIELGGGDGQHAVVIPGPLLVGRDSAYVVPHLALRDVNNDGHVDLLLTLRGETVVYLNHDGAFQSPDPAELVQLHEQEH